MATIKALVLRTAGTNCDLETEHALEMAGFSADRIHIFRIMENPAILDEYQFLVFPGGFSYGDDVAAGKILANQMLHRLAEPLNKFVADGKLMLGICNGFQVLIKSGLLPWGNVDPATAHRDATLGWNDCGQFVDKWVHLSCDSSKCVFLPKGEVIALPIAHGEGKFVPRDDEILARLRNDDQIALRYTNQAGTPGGEANPNGSVDDIAGICDPTGRILGLMPHPERFVRATHHPQWTRKDIPRPDGNLFFDGAMAYLK
ncbi:MAG: phosphoribosylformylglycinamidine synthase I [Phycisphaerae bacterium]|nr:phosphoribosylformylglycinamidine synthase I [Phycisphaerae bacterium]